MLAVCIGTYLLTIYLPYPTHLRYLGNLLCNT